MFAFYAAFWAYGGYDNVGNIVEEIKQPLRRNVPISVITALVLVIAIYVLGKFSFKIEWLCSVFCKVISSPAIGFVKLSG